MWDRVFFSCTITTGACSDSQILAVVVQAIIGLAMDHGPSDVWGPETVVVLGVFRLNQRLNERDMSTVIYVRGVMLHRLICDGVYTMIVNIDDTIR